MRSFPMRKFSRLHLDQEKPVIKYRVNPKKLAELEKSMGLSQALELLTPRLETYIQERLL